MSLGVWYVYWNYSSEKGRCGKSRLKRRLETHALVTWSVMYRVLVN